MKQQRVRVGQGGRLIISAAMRSTFCEPKRAQSAITRANLMNIRRNDQAVDRNSCILAMSRCNKMHFYTRLSL